MENFDQQFRFQIDEFEHLVKRIYAQHKGREDYDEMFQLSRYHESILNDVYTTRSYDLRYTILDNAIRILKAYFNVSS